MEHNELEQARQHTVQGLSHISQFWGFSKGMGAIYGAIYLSPTALSLDELVEQVGITKGAISTNVRQLERLGLVHKQVRLGERRDFYTAETDFWMIVKNILNEREKSEFDRAIRTVGESADMVRAAGELSEEEAELAAFTLERLQNLADFFKSLDNLVATVIALENLRAGTLGRLTGKSDE